MEQGSLTISVSYPGSHLFAPSSVTVAGVVNPALPTTKGQCLNGGWQSYPVFKNQGDCVSWIATNGKNRPTY